MPARPSVIVFDVNGTLSDMGPLADRFVDVGAPDHLAKLWFATVLRDGFALTAAGEQQPFSALAEEALRGMLPGVETNRPVDEAVQHVMQGFQTLAVHPDVVDGIRRLRELGLRLVTLSNGATAVAEGLLTRNGVIEEFQQLLSVEDAGAWKPSRAAYEYAARACGVEVADLMLVAVHAWDIDGAARAGASTAWINRTGAPYPAYFTAADHSLTSLTELAAVLSPR